MSHILLIEDNPDNQDLLSRQLERKGYTVVCAEDGQSGLQLAFDAPPDLILLDLNLPLIDGWEIARRLKSDATTRSIPIMAVTAFSMPGDRKQALEAGCDEYATKPIDFPVIHGKVQELLGRNDEP